MPFRAESPDLKSQMKYIIYDLEKSDFKPVAFLEMLFFLACLDTQLQFINYCLPFILLL